MGWAERARRRLGIIGPTVPVKNLGTRWRFSVEEPCWQAFMFDGGEKDGRPVVRPLSHVHQCDRGTAEHVFSTVAAALGQERIAIAPDPDCKCREGESRAIPEAFELKIRLERMDRH